MADDEIYAPITNLRNTVIFLAPGNGCHHDILSVVIARKIARPMIEGVAFAQAVAAGDMTGQLDIKSQRTRSVTWPMP